MNTILKQQEASNIIEPHLSSLKLIMVESLEEVNKILSFASERINKRAKCCLLHSIAMEKAKKYFTDLPNITISEKYQSIQIVFNDKLVGRIKKVNKDNFSSNIKTKRNSAILSHQLTLFQDMQTLTFVDLGYEIDSTWAEFKRHVVVCRVNKSIEWYIDFTEANNDVIFVQPKQLETIAIKEEKQIKIKKAQ